MVLLAVSRGAAFQQSPLAGTPGKRRPRPQGAPLRGRARWRVGGENRSSRSHHRGLKSTHGPGSGCGSCNGMSGVTDDKTWEWG